MDGRIGRGGSFNISPSTTNRHVGATKNTINKGHRRLNVTKLALNQIPKSERSNIKLTSFTPLNTRSVYPVTVNTTYLNASGVRPFSYTQSFHNAQTFNVSGEFNLQFSSGLTLSFGQGGQCYGGFYQPQANVLPQPLYIFSGDITPLWGQSSQVSQPSESVSDAEVSKHTKKAKKKRRNSLHAFFSKKNKRKKPGRKEKMNASEAEASKTRGKPLRPAISSELSRAIENRAKKIVSGAINKKKKSPARPPVSEALTAAIAARKQSQLVSSAYSQNVEVLPSVGKHEVRQGQLQTKNSELHISSQNAPKRPTVSRALKQPIVDKKRESLQAEDPLNSEKPGSSGKVPQGLPLPLEKSVATPVSHSVTVKPTEIPKPPPPPPLPPFSSFNNVTYKDAVKQEQKDKDAAVISTPPSSLSNVKEEGIYVDVNSALLNETHKPVRPTTDELQAAIALRKKRKNGKDHAASGEKKAEGHKSDDFASEMKQRLNARRQNLGYEKEESDRTTVSSSDPDITHSEGTKPDRAALNRAIESFDSKGLKKTSSDKVKTVGSNEKKESSHEVSGADSNVLLDAIQSFDKNKRLKKVKQDAVDGGGNKSGKGDLRSGGINFSSPAIDEMLNRSKQNQEEGDTDDFE